MFSMFLKNIVFFSIFSIFFEKYVSKKLKKLDFLQFSIPFISPSEARQLKKLKKLHKLTIIFFNLFNLFEKYVYQGSNRKSENLTRRKRWSRKSPLQTGWLQYPYTCTHLRIRRNRSFQVKQQQRHARNEFSLRSNVPRTPNQVIAFAYTYI